jgi:hypothetical protein
MALSTAGMCDVGVCEPGAAGETIRVSCCSDEAGRKAAFDACAIRWALACHAYVWVFMGRG